MKKIALFSIILGAFCITSFAMADGQEFTEVCSTDGIVCYKIPRRGPIVQGCKNTDIGQPCPNAKKVQENATKTKCIWVKKTSASDKEPSCAATECKNGYLLWLSKDKTGEYRSMGVCHTEKFAADSCENGCKKCNPNEECVPNLVPTPETHKQNGAYKDCICKSKEPQQQTESPAQQPGAEEQCTYYFSGTIKCDGKEVEIEGTKEVKVPCVNKVPDNTVINNIETMFENDIGNLRQIREKLCATAEESTTTSGSATSSGATVSSATTVNYQSAEAILDKFVSNAESERSVWKNADGKFNTTRLASDITAGVVLGTVGGVVTGVVIKKNQVKKGFEALHCTVGGQKVAEWDDEFSVGLRR